MHLNLAGNEMQGTLEPLAGLKHLKHVDLRVNQLQVDAHACARALTNARPSIKPSGQPHTAHPCLDPQGPLPLELIRMKCRKGGTLLLHSNPGFTLPANFSTLCDEGDLPPPRPRPRPHSYLRMRFDDIHTLPQADL